MPSDFKYFPLAVVCAGAKALKAALAEVCPVPPLAIAKVAESPAAVPEVFWLNVGQVKVPVLKLPEAGVPNAGVTKEGELDNTTEPEPVEVVTPVPPLATGSVPVTPVVKGKPVTFVMVPDAGVPSAGVTKVGELDRTLLPDPVEVVTPVPPLTTNRTPEMSLVLRSMASHEVLVPSDFRYLPLAEAWLGARALKAALAVV